MPTVETRVPNLVRPAFERGGARDHRQHRPSHPATHGTIQVIAALDGEKVQRGRALRYLHRGFEKECVKTIPGTT